ncbi:MAG: VOC family protein [Chloroflexota bacterium]
MVNPIALDHVQLAMPVGEEIAARQFYGELLGLEEVSKPAPLADRGGCWFKGANVVIHLGVEADFHPARKAHPAFRVADLEASRQAFEMADVSVRMDTSVPHVRRFFVSDPFGNRLEFIQEGDSF